MNILKQLFGLPVREQTPQIRLSRTTTPAPPVPFIGGAYLFWCDACWGGVSLEGFREEACPLCHSPVVLVAKHVANKK